MREHSKKGDKMARACVMRNGTIYNPANDTALLSEDPVLPGFDEELVNEEESVSAELLPESEEAAESADENSEAEGHSGETDALPEESEEDEIVPFGASDEEEK